MNENNISVRELNETDIPLLMDYWYKASPGYLKGMGADINLLPDKDGFKQFLISQLKVPFEQKQAYGLIWLLDNNPIGHCNVNRIEYGESAFMHLHVWNAANRNRGNGTSFVKLSVPWFFRNLELKKLISEPYALNPAPQKTLEKAGFSFVKTYVTTPGNINFEQKVNRWEMDRKKADL